MEDPRVNKLERFVERHPKQAAAAIVFIILSVVWLFIWLAIASKGVSVVIIVASLSVYGFYRWVLEMIEGER